MLEINQYRSLGASGLMVPAVGIGTNKWGMGQGVNNAELLQTFQSALQARLAFFDTAELYNAGRSERLLGECLRRQSDVSPALIASKFAPLVTRFSPHSLMDALDESLHRLGLETLDLYYVHWPFAFLRVNALMDMMALAVRTGKIRAVGVSNYTSRQMRLAAARLASYKIPLAANQVHYSLLHRNPETNGVLAACRELNVALVAWWPLEGGILKAREPQSSRPSLRLPSRVFPASNRVYQERLAALQRTLLAVAERREKSVSQVALNWLLLRDEHVIVIPGATSARHVQENLATLDWQLSGDEFREIDQASSHWRTTF